MYDIDLPRIQNLQNEKALLSDLKQPILYIKITKAIGFA